MSDEALVATAVEQSPGEPEPDVSSGIPESDIPAPSPETTETPEVSAEATEPSPDTGTEPLPKDVQRALRELRASPENATIARALQDTYYTTRAFKEVFPTVEDARATKATLDALGGPEGIVSLQEQVNGIERIDAGVERGDSWVVESMFETSPEGAAKLVQHGMQLLERQNPAAFASMLQPVLVNSVLSSGIGDRIADALQALSEGDTRYVERNLKAVYSWLEGLSRQSEHVRAPAGTEPSALDSERQALATQRLELTQRQVAGDLRVHLDTAISKDLGALAGAKSLSAEARSDFASSVIAEINRTLGSDKVYQTNINSLMRKGDVDRAVNYARTQVDAVRAKAVRAVWNRRYASMQPARTSPKPGVVRSATQPGKTTASLVAQKPPIDQMDMEKTSFEEYIAGRGYLKNGRYVTWAKARPTA